VLYRPFSKTTDRQTDREPVAPEGRHRASYRKEYRTHLSHREPVYPLRQRHDLVVPSGCTSHVCAKLQAQHVQQFTDEQCNSQNGKISRKIYSAMVKQCDGCHMLFAIILHILITIKQQNMQSKTATKLRSHNMVGSC